MCGLLSGGYDGEAHAARDWVGEWLEQRKPTNRGAARATLRRFQEAVGNIDTLLFASHNLLHAAANGQVSSQHSAQIKFLVTQNAQRAVELALEASGNPGLSRSNPLQRHYRNVLCARVHTPQNDAVLQGIGKAVFAALQS